MSNQDVIFADGFSFKRKDSAPEFVIGRLSIKKDEAIKMIEENSKNGWLNIDVKKSKSGNYYCQVDTWVPSEAPSSENNASDDDEPPF